MIAANGCPPHSRNERQRVNAEKQKMNLCSQPVLLELIQILTQVLITNKLNSDIWG